MRCATVIGVETEYGVLINGVKSSDPFWASEVLLAQCEDGIDAGLSADVAIQRFDRMLPNGARFYIDHAHPEYSTPEALTPRDVVAADKAGEALVARCAARALARGALPSGAELVLYKNNSDQKGNSYGCHENYLVSPRLFSELIDGGKPGRLAQTALIPFLVTRSILCGSGKVGSENGSSATGFQLSQRADFLETLVGLQTTYRRPILNTRDEPHADAQSHRRLHVIVGDANMAEHSTLLKVGMTQLVLMMLEEGTALPDFTLASPMHAARVVSRDLTLKTGLPLESGVIASALAIQRAFVERARSFLDVRSGLDPQREVVALWSDALGRMERDWRLVSDRLDWAIKRDLVERYLNRRGVALDATALWQDIIARTAPVLKYEAIDRASSPLAALRASDPTLAIELERSVSEAGLSWDDYRLHREIYFALRRLDLEYHDIRRPSGSQSGGLFQRLLAAGAVARLIEDDAIERLVGAPPRDTRAYLRGRCIERYAPFLRSVDWGELTFADPADGTCRRLVLDHPLRGTEAEMAALLDASPTPWPLFDGPTNGRHPKT